MLYSHFFAVFACIILIGHVNIVASQTNRLCLNSVTLGVGETKKVCCSAFLCVKSIQESRCPANVVCIWEGQARVNLTLSTNTASSSVELIIGANAQPTAQITLASATYGVTLQDVVPYPGTSNAPSRAVIKVRCPYRYY